MIEPYPGPWHVYDCPDTGRVCVHDSRPERFVVCDIPGDMETIEGEEFANAMLIAAAPDFLAACEGHEPEIGGRLSWLSALLAHLDKDGWARQGEDPDANYHCLWECRQLLDELRAAVAKAKGGAA